MASTHSPKLIYLDYHATSPVDRRAAKKIMAFMTSQFGNASSADHVVGDRLSPA